MRGVAQSTPSVDLRGSLSWCVMRSVIADVFDVDRVFRNDAELAERADQGHIVSNGNRADVEE